MNKSNKQKEDENVEIIPFDTYQFKQKTYDKFLEERHIIVNDIIDDNVFESLTMQIMNFNMEDRGVSPIKRQPIVLHINSNGGSVNSGLSVINAINQSITPIYAVCWNACSMAAYIFISCHKRFAFKNSILLFHDGSTMLSGTSSKVKDTMAWYNNLEERLDNIVLMNSLVTEDEYYAKRRDEWYMFGDEAKEKGFVDSIIGEDSNIESFLDNK